MISNSKHQINRRSDRICKLDIKKPAKICESCKDRFLCWTKSKQPKTYLKCQKSKQENRKYKAERWARVYKKKKGKE